MVKCPHAASGCDYPASECAGHCASKQQPEALRLADALDAVNTNNADSLLVQMAARSAAAELRRLHTENEVIRHSSGRVGRRLERTSDALMEARAQRDELLAALHLALEYWAHREQRYKNRSPVWVQKSRAAIAKAGGAA